MRTSSEGYSWTKSKGTRLGGFRCKGIISPAERLDSDREYDVIVVGAGYAGLSAARDLATSGRSVLLLEARDRVGGRTYTLEDDNGFLYEMGGTWITHHYGYVLKEMFRYNMEKDLVNSHQSGYENDYYTIQIPGQGPRRMTHEEAGEITRRAWDMFVDVDGDMCRKVCPLPHSQLDNIMVDRKEVEKLDNISFQDRLDEIKDRLTPEEMGVLSALLLLVSGGKLENSSLWEAIRSQSLLTHSSRNFADIWTTYKLRQGQSVLARRMFNEAVDFGLQYAFNTLVTSISDESNDAHGRVKVTSSKGNTFTARRVICTIPLNVLKSIRFSPPLSPKRQEAINLGHINFMTKIHALVEGSGLASWNGMTAQGYLIQGYGDEVTPDGEAHIVGFGGDERENFVPEEEPEKVVEAFNKMHPMKVNKTVFHNWCTDPYAQGGPAWWAPGYMSKYQDELQSAHGAILFASGDWAHGWRASIDGALEQGSLCGIRALRELHRADTTVERKLKL